MFDDEVAEHFRRSLSGKWPRRQPNYAHYISPSFNTPKTMIENNLGHKMASQPSLKSSPTQFSNLEQLTSHLSSDLINSQSNNQYYNNELQNTNKTQKTSLLLKTWQNYSTPIIPDMNLTSSTIPFATPSQSVQISNSTINNLNNNINYNILPTKQSNVSTKIIINEKQLGILI